MVHGTIIKQLNNFSLINKGEYHYRLKMLEFNNIKTLQTATMGIVVTQNAMKDRLKNSSLGNKQKAEVLLVAEMEAYRVVDGLIKSTEENLKE